MIKFCPSAIIRTQVQQFRLSLQYIQIIHYSFSISSFPFFSGACSIFHPHILPPITTATDIAIIMISCIDNHPPYFPVTVPRAVVFSHANKTYAIYIGCLERMTGLCFLPVLIMNILNNELLTAGCSLF